ncbi:12258_t:CDS:2 [Acaulospora morrowiae]|uniref:12258_t:CDS:1 n=1 Tax=Acaulospora morrowiae TaxID=94023 RepID=A0A9N9BUC6_9GLOM|nr:12258_t:CDS:2 [Acaulospora morrowiae]
MWTDDQLRLLINERKNKNTEYHDIPGSSRVDFWNSMANTINDRFGTSYTGHQCKNRFQNLVRDYNSMCLYIAGSKTGKRSRAGERYFEEFSTRFWDRPETPFDRLHNENISTRRRYLNRTPPTYRATSISSRREFTTIQRDRSASPNHRDFSNRREYINRDNTNNVVSRPLAVNNTGGDSGHNADDVSGNLNNATYKSSSDLANNISASKNDSEVSMRDVGSSQPVKVISEDS